MCIGMANGGKIMTPQKALNRLDETVTGNLEWKIVLSNALEKQIPKRPTYEETGNVYGALKRTCAKCGDICFIGEDAKPFEHYCRYCGQKFDDWSDTE
jgi:hypothetical protein